MRWEAEDERMEYKKQYEMCVVDTGVYEPNETQEHFVMTREGKSKVVMRHYQGREEYDNVVAICTENSRQD